MARSFFVNGETLVQVKGRVDSPIASITQLGLADAPIRITLDYRHKDAQVDAWGGEVPPDTQFMLAEARISMTLIHFDFAVLQTCLQLSMAGAPAEGQMARAGQFMGNGQAQFAAAVQPTGLLAGNNYISLNLSSPVQGIPWRFFFSYLSSPPMEFPLGTEKSVVALNWRAIPYTIDPYNGGLGAYGAPLYDHGQDT